MTTAGNNKESTISTEILLRFDDICPTMNWKVWMEVEAALVERGIKAMLAVVPDNRDPVLMVDAPAEEFWPRMRQCQARGWTIALHGYQHLYVTENAGLAGRRKKSEFAGLPAGEQDEKLRRGIEILTREDIHPTVWIAPGHTFDRTTILLLGKYGIRIICDGFFRYPHREKDGTFWVPQQLWEFQPAPKGVWTVCFHINGWGTSDLEAFRRDLVRYREQIGSLDQVIEKFGDRRRRWTEYIYYKPRLAYYLLRAELELRARL
jgi:predicted deacetylase